MNNSVIENSNFPQETIDKYRISEELSGIGHWECLINDISDWTSDNNFLWWSPGTYKILKLTEDEFDNKVSTFFNMIHPDDISAYTKAINNAVENRTGYDEIFRYVLLDGDIKYMRGIANISYSKDGKPIKMFGTTLDVTEQVLLSEKIHHEDKLRSLGQLAGGIAHDFNNLLAGIVNGAEALLCNPHLTKEQRKAGENIVHSGITAGKQTRKLFQFSKPQEDFFTIIKVKKVISEALDIVNLGHDKKINIIEKNLDSSLSILGNDGQFQAVLINVLLNAIEALPDKNGNIAISLKKITSGELKKQFFVYSQLSNSDFLYIKISDNGCGIPPELIEKVTEPFFTTKHIIGGSGLGLSMVENTIGNMNGYITFSSFPQEGTQVHIFIPLYNELPVVEESNDVTVQENIKILLVDDNLVTGSNLKISLEAHSISVELVNSGEEAFNRAQNELFDIIISDIIMPGMTGVDLYTELLNIECKSGFLFLTGYSGDEGKDILNLPEILLKPIRIEELLKAINRVIRNKTGE